LAQKVIIDSTGVPMWYVTFADLSTLMLTFFVLLLSFANMDVQAFKEMLGSVQGAFGVVIEQDGETSPFVMGEDAFDKEITEEEKKQKVAAKKKQDKNSKEEMQDAVDSTSLKDNTTIFMRDNKLIIRVDGGTFFKSGSAHFKKEARKLLDSLVEVLKKTDYNLTVEGHTDNVPIHTRRYPSNWELSGVRATTVLRYLVYKGIDVDRLKAVGNSSTRPIMDNDTPEGRAKNRRVEFILASGDGNGDGEKADSKK